MWKAIAVSVMAGCGLVFLDAVRADVFDDAVRLCTAIEKTGMSTECTTSGYRQAVDVRFNTNAAEAHKICTGLVEVAAQQRLSFAGKWKLRIFSPYSGVRWSRNCCGWRCPW
jgi:hypothetical protein